MTSARFRAGMVGAGNISEFHIHAVRAVPGIVDLVGVTDLDAARAEATSKVSIKSEEVTLLLSGIELERTRLKNWWRRSA
jgi:hypothetical protein